VKSDHLLSLLLACTLIAGSVAWLSNRIDTPTDQPPANLQTVRTVSPPEEQLSPNAAAIRRESDGHFWTRADVDGSSLKFLVDTGASVVALTWYDAKRLRLNPETLDFSWTVSTANGQTSAASVLIDSISIGNVEIKNVEAIVMHEEDLQNSLLGMSFLGQLYSYEFKGNTMIIRQ